LDISIRNARFAKIGLQDLIDYIGDCSDMIMVEIGSYVGDSTEIFAKNFKTVFAVDPWVNGYDDNDGASYRIPMDQVEAQFDKLCKKYSNIVKLKVKSEKGILHFEKYSLDFVYIDAIHNYSGVRNDLQLWMPKVKKNSFIAGHDYTGHHFPGVKKAVDEFFIPDKTFRDSSWIKKL